jgi:hypothetical protein
VDKLSQKPDVKVATVPTDGARFIIDMIATKDTGEAVSGSLVVVQTFPMEEFRPRIKEGEDATALLKNIRFYTLLRLHEVIPAQANDPLCTRHRNIPSGPTNQSRPPAVGRLARLGLWDRLIYALV